MGKKRLESPWLDVDQIRAEASVEEILKRHSLWEDCHLKGDQVRLVSPGSQSKQRSLSIHLRKGVWQDFDQLHLDPEGQPIPRNIIGLEMLLSRVSFREALEILFARQGVIETLKETKEGAEEEIQANVPFKKKLAVRTHHLPYFEPFGIKESTLKRFDVGFYSGPGLLRNYIVFPVRDRTKEIVFYFGEAVRASQSPQRKFPPGVHRSLELYNIDQVLHDEEARAQTLQHGLIVTEHPNDVLKLYQEGWLNAVAIMDHTVSDQQVKLLIDERLNPSRKVCLALGQGALSRLGRKESARRLLHHSYVRYANMTGLEEGTHQLAELSKANLESVLGFSATH